MASERILLGKLYSKTGTKIESARMVSRYVLDRNPMPALFLHTVNTRASFARRMDPDLNPFP